MTFEKDNTINHKESRTDNTRTFRNIKYNSLGEWKDFPKTS